MYWQIKFGKEQFSIIKRDILITHEFAPFYGGVATYCQEVCSAASRLGRDVVAWLPGDQDSKDPANIVRLGGEVSLRLDNVLRLAHQILKRRSIWNGQRLFLASMGSHWIFAHLWRLGLTGKTRMIPIFHGSEILRYESNPWLRLLVSRWLNSCERVVAASAFTQKLLQGSSLVSAGIQVELAPCAVRQDLLEQARLQTTSNPLLDDMSGPFKVLTLARLHPRKGQSDVIQALGLLSQPLRQRIIYQLAGTGKARYREELQKLARSLGVTLEFLGATPDVRLGQVYGGCDLYVMSSRTLASSIEGFGMTYLEAGVFGKPVVGYLTGGVEGAVIDEQTGLLVEEGDIPALSRAIQRLLGDGKLRQQLGEAGKRHALSFNWERTVEILFKDTQKVEGGSPYTP